jgi:hypothetical protein
LQNLSLEHWRFVFFDFSQTRSRSRTLSSWCDRRDRGTILVTVVAT